MVIAVDENETEKALKAIHLSGERACVIGKVISGAGGIELC